jgi:hypothetical protein
MNRNFEIPVEEDFIGWEFYPSDKDDHDEGIISYCKRYEDNRQLIVSFYPYGIDSKVTAEIVDGDIVIASIASDEVSSIAFQGWGNEQVIRVYRRNCNNEFIVYFNPQPRIFMGELT